MKKNLRNVVIHRQGDLSGDLLGLSQLVNHAQAGAKLRTLDHASIQMAIGELEKAQSTCAARTLSPSVIRIELSGGNSDGHYAEATFLAWDGSEWSAWRGRANAPTWTTYLKVWLALTELQMPRKEANRLGATRKAADGYSLFLHPPELAAVKEGAPRRRHAWVKVEDQRVCSECGLASRYSWVAPRAGGNAVKVAGSDTWWIISRLPPCPTTEDTPIEVGYAR